MEFDLNILGQVRKYPIIDMLLMRKNSVFIDSSCAHNPGRYYDKMESVRSVELSVRKFYQGKYVKIINFEICDIYYDVMACIQISFK